METPSLQVLSAIVLRFSAFLDGPRSMLFALAVARLSFAFNLSLRLKSKNAKETLFHSCSFLFLNVNFVLKILQFLGCLITME